MKKLLVVLLFVLQSFAGVPLGTIVGGPVVPSDSSDIYPTHSEDWGRGGFRAVADLAGLGAISNARKKEGMLVYRIDNNITYQLRDVGNGLDWQVYKDQSVTDSSRAASKSDSAFGIKNKILTLDSLYMSGGTDINRAGNAEIKRDLSLFYNKGYESLLMNTNSNGSTITTINTTGGAFLPLTFSSSKYLFSPMGNVGLGATQDPESKLTVMGDFTMRNPASATRGAWLSSGGNNFTDRILVCKSGDSAHTALTAWSSGSVTMGTDDQYARLSVIGGIYTDSLAVRAIGRNVKIDSISTNKTIGGGGSVINYLATSDISGWDSFGYCYLSIYKIGRIAHCAFQITGISNTTQTSFTLPWVSATNTGELFICRCINGSELGGNFELCTANVGATGVVSFNPSLQGNGEWEMGGTRTIQGSFSYITQ